MIAFAVYILKVIICSGLFAGYYYLALRNKLFHQWNRFYLLITVLLSLTIPLIQFTIFQGSEQKSAINWLQYINAGDELFVGVTNETNVAADFSLWPVYVYSFVVIILLGSLAYSVYKLGNIIRRHPSKKIHNIRFINSNTKGTPFSFFQYIFWNPGIDVNTKTGQQIFKHELVHIKEGHTIDKLMMQIVLAFFWCNPFFWLIRYELKMIHEFIADKKATEQGNVSQFAAMILQTAYPKHFNIINPFFHTSIKRRLTMLTKKKSRGFNYVTRILALPLIAFIILSFAVKVKDTAKSYAAEDLLSPNETQMVIDTIPVKLKKEIDSINVIKNDVEIFYKDGTKEILNAGEAYKRGLIHPAIKESTVNSKEVNGEAILIRDEKQFTGLIVLDGKIYKEKINDINPESIQSISVLKDKPAIIKYGDKGKNGVIEIVSKANSLNKIKLQNDKDESVKDTIPKNMGRIRRIEFLKDEKAWIFFENGLEITTWQKAVDKNYISKEKADQLIIEIKTKKHPLIIVNGKEEPSFTESSLYIYQNDAAKINKLSSAEAINKYGSKGANGVIEITNEEKPHSITFTKVEIPPKFPGGEVAFRKFLEKNLNAKVPVEHRAPSGVYVGEVQFIVDIDGSVSNIQAITKHGFGIEHEIIRVMSISPKWVAASQNKRSVKAYHKQKITFVIAAK